MDELRRRPRVQTPGWSGRCSMEGTTYWAECRVVDVSLNGAGLELLERAGDIGIGTRLVFVLDSNGSVFLRLAGDVRRVDPLVGGAASVGIQFADLSETEMAVLGAIQRLKISG